MLLKQRGREVVRAQLRQPVPAAPSPELVAAPAELQEAVAPQPLPASAGMGAPSVMILTEPTVALAQATNSTATAEARVHTPRVLLTQEQKKAATILRMKALRHKTQTEELAKHYVMDIDAVKAMGEEERGEKVRVMHKRKRDIKTLKNHMSEEEATKLNDEEREAKLVQVRKKLRREAKLKYEKGRGGTGAGTGAPR